MSVIFRLANRNLYPKLYSKTSDLIIRRWSVTLSPRPYKPPRKQTHDQFNMKLGRPQSPHLTIYAAELTSMFSITHRMTGAALTFYTAALATAALALPPGELTPYIDCLEDLELPYPTNLVIKFAIAFPFCYHMCNGIRHLLWDFGPGGLLSMKGVYITGYIMIISAFTSAVLLTTMEVSDPCC